MAIGWISGLAIVTVSRVDPGHPGMFCSEWISGRLGSQRWFNGNRGDLVGMLGHIIIKFTVSWPLIIPGVSRVTHGWRLAFRDSGAFGNSSLSERRMQAWSPSSSSSSEDHPLKLLVSNLLFCPHIVVDYYLLCVTGGWYVVITTPPQKKKSKKGEHSPKFLRNQNLEVSKLRHTHRIHVRKLTWNLKMMVSNRNLLFQGFIFRFHVKFRGSTRV